MNSILRKITSTDTVMLVSILFLTAIGLVMIYSASSPLAEEKFGDHAYFLKRHVLFLGIGSLILMFCFLVKFRFFRIFAFPALIAIGGMLLATRFVGVSANHARRWISLGGFAFQPSEFAKPVLIIYIATYLAKKSDRLKDFSSGLLPILCTVGSVLMLILAQPDFGTAMNLGIVFLLMLFVAGVPFRYFLALGSVACMGAMYLMTAASYRKKRLLTFLNPWADPQGSGFQIIQSFIAFKRGGLQGQGLGDGTQKLLYLPEAHTDFIYSVIAEELGVLGSLTVVLLFTLIVVQGIRLSLRIKDRFASLVAFGLTTMIGLQGLLNMAVTMALVPTKGLTLPFVSYGGSSLISLFASAGILLSLSASVNVTGKMAKKVLQ